MKQRIIQTICPRCNGTGYSRAFNYQKKFSKDIMEKAEKLYLNGKTLREIAKELEINHPQTIKNILIRTGSMTPYNRNLRKK